MPYELADRLVVGVASSALFDMAESDAVFRSQGEEAYRLHQEAHIDGTLKPGVAFPFLRRLLALNDLRPDDPLVEVIVLSKNDPSTGLRVMRSIATHGLDITRSVFTQGKAPYDYIPALDMSLFLSGDPTDVRAAVDLGLPAGQVPSSSAATEDDGHELRIAFDFDGVLAADDSERIYQGEGVEKFREHEQEHQAIPLNPGPLSGFLRDVNRIQSVETRARTRTRRTGPGSASRSSRPATHRPTNERYGRSSSGA
ncbi:5'-nucleotidase [Isoptericola sp. 4D.3]|uniref:5'-nucleotidase n=1 Tax=Isoptericola peretonis TaxID=2918523 RepID=A0ABT0IYJ6_9MICO|nr:5'-nucleotidase [Isoptericola sp. 4D.3]